MSNTTSIQTVDKSDRPVEFVPYGAADKIKLTVKIVQNIVAVPTKSGRTCSERDALRFVMLCQAQRLNPFAGDAFLVGYDGKDGPSFSLITAHQAFLKRAENCPDFDGMESGLIIADGDGVREIEGDFHLKDQEVLGGWAKVYHKKRSKTTYRRIRMERFNKGFAQWQADPAGMICKCAEADALRSTFPTLLGGLYIEGEQQARTVDISASVVASPALVQVVSQETAPEVAKDEQPVMETPKYQVVEESSPQILLENLLKKEGFTIDDFQKWGEGSGSVPDAGSYASFEEIPNKVAARLLTAKTGLLKGLKETRGCQ